MSTVRATVEKIRDLRSHSNADALQLATVRGWQVCVKKDQFREGDSIIYLEAGLSVPKDKADEWAVSAYLSEKSDIDGKRVLVVKRVRLRGEPSFGLVMPLSDAILGLGVSTTDFLEEGDDISLTLGVCKYDPPVKHFSGGGGVSSGLPELYGFERYTDIENLRNYPHVLQEGEIVVVTEKIHGTNVRFGLTRQDVVTRDPHEFTPYDDCASEWVWTVGSRRIRRPVEDPSLYATHFTEMIHDFLEVVRTVYAARQGVVLYGEIYGPGIQSMTYGLAQPQFVAFDLSIDGRYLDSYDMYGLCQRAHIPVVPLLHCGPYHLAIIKSLTEGPSVVGGETIKEGVVVRPLHERTDPKLGRVVVKYLSDEYLLSKKSEGETTDV